MVLSTSLLQKIDLEN